MAAVLLAFGAVGHSTNQFSFDLGGVRLYFLLPVDPRRVVLTKNVLCMTIVVVEVLLIVATATVFRLPLPWLPAILAMVGLLTALPVQLVIGNRSSVINAVPATWRMGMRPPRMDTRAAVAPMLGLAGVAVAVIAPPSPRISPLRSREKGRHVSGDTTRIASQDFRKPKENGASLPPAIAASTIPVRTIQTA